MGDIRSNIRRLRCRNSDGQYFVPIASYLEYMSRNTVTEALTEGGTEAWKIDEMISIAMEGARQLLGILVMIRWEKLFVAFVEQHQGDSKTLDAQLPFTKERLFFVDPHIAEEFLENQWIFVSPVFSVRLTHRYFHDETILPFVENSPLDEGGFGRVFLVKVHAEHHNYGDDFQSQHHCIVRKELDTRRAQSHQLRQKSSRALAKDEHTVLWLLNHLKHPNILQLLASYTFKGVHNFLFPAFSSGNLKQILQSSAAYGDSWSESDYLSAVSGLSSAIEHLHVYHLESMNIMLIGCHNDIKPANILVSGKRFILADFGLSTMREGDDSKTPFKVGNGIYKAPECEDYNNDFRPGDIGRSTDIWAFGCIILEVLAYMLTGAEGVAGFRSDRRVEIPSVITTFAFHKGMLPNPGVERWLAKLEDMGSPFTKTLLQEVRKMLSLMPQERPKAARVSSLLNYLVAASTFCVVEDGLSNVSEEFETLDLHIERERFRLLGWVLALDKLSFSGNVSQNPSLSKRFNTLIDPLRETSELVTTALKEGLEASLGVLQRTCNDKIAALLEPNEIQRVKARVYLRFLSSEGDEGGDLSAFVTAALHTEYNTASIPLLLIHVFCATIAFEEAGDDTLEFPHNRDIGKQLAAKQILLLMSKADQNLDKSLLINRDSLCNRRSFQAGELASLIDFNEENTTKTVPVLIGWITYDTRWIGDVGNTLLDRVGTIAKVLKSISKLCLFPTMPCKGFFHELKQHAFGLVYEIPTVQSLAMELHDPAYISSLNTLIETTKNVRHRPPLEHIYELASNLSVALLEFHKVGWLHKSLSSYCILIPRAIEVSGDVRVLNFYICGFNYSRSDRPDEYSHGLCEKTDRAALYHHPDYRQGKSRYCRSFDRYSLGLLLLELGLWKPLHEMRVGMNSGKSTTDKSHPAPVKGESEVQTEDPSEFSRHILRQFVPLLGPRMGSRYKKAVMHFLSGVEVLEEPDLLSFESECVNELKRCLQNES